MKEAQHTAQNTHSPPLTSDKDNLCVQKPDCSKYINGQVQDYVQVEVNSNESTSVISGMFLLETLPNGLLIMAGYMHIRSEDRLFIVYDNKPSQLKYNERFCYSHQNALILMFTRDPNLLRKYS